MKKAIAIILLLTMTISLFACGKSSNQSNTPATTLSESEKEAQESKREAERQAKEKEDYIFEAIKDYLPHFKSPASVRLMEVSYGPNFDDEDIYYLRISAQNGMGGSVIDDYTIGVDGKLNDQSYNTMYSAKSVNDISIGNINKSIEEYCDSMGWN